MGVVTLFLPNDEMIFVREYLRKSYFLFLACAPFHLVKYKYTDTDNRKDLPNPDFLGETTAGGQESGVADTDSTLEIY